MPIIEVRFYQEADGTVPVMEWIDGLPKKIRNKCTAYVDRLTAVGHELRRPTAAPLRDKIRELRHSYQGVHYRILYFFYGQGVAVLAHGCTKEGAVADTDINLAMRRRKKFIKDPTTHTYTDEGREGDRPNDS